MAKRSREENKQRLVNDAAKSLLANIRFMSVDTPIKTIEITSAIPNEGKSFVSINLAQAIASSGKTCLIMEGDLRKRSLAAAMGIHPKNGLYSVLSGEVSFKKAAVATPQRKLYFLDAEPEIPNPPDLFGSQRFSEFLAQVEQMFDYVLIDTAPVGTFVDAAVVSTNVDAVLLVVRENFTRKKVIEDAYDQLIQAGANVAGVVMNDCGSSRESYYDYYSYYENYDKSDNDALSALADSLKPSADEVSQLDANVHTANTANTTNTANRATHQKQAQRPVQQKSAQATAVPSGMAPVNVSSARKRGNSPFSKQDSAPIDAETKAPHTGVKHRFQGAADEAQKYSRANYRHRSEGKGRN